MGEPWLRHCLCSSLVTAKEFSFVGDLKRSSCITIILRILHAESTYSVELIVFTFVTIFGPMRNEKDVPITSATIAIAVDVVRWFAGNHVAERAGGPPWHIGPANPTKI